MYSTECECVCVCVCVTGEMEERQMGYIADIQNFLQNRTHRTIEKTRQYMNTIQRHSKGNKKGSGGLVEYLENTRGGWQEPEVPSEYTE